MHRIERINELTARQVLTWRYTDQYALYNPSEETLEEDLAALLNPQYNYYVVHDGETLIGYCCFGEDAQVPGGDYSLPDALDIGLGLRPDLTGQGRGADFLAAILKFAQQEYRPRYFRATIAAFNLRSQRVFAKTGFRPVQTFMNESARPLQFVVMVKDVLV
jgi:RimJ/RimL family protein N-acetyltransferase